MEKSLLNRKHKLFLLLIILAFLALSFGFGYFFGRYEQIQLNKSLLKPVPDVNCDV